MSSLLSLCWHRYLQRLERYPLQTKAETASVIAAAADIVAQWLDGKAWNWHKTLALATYGLAWSGPAAHLWYSILEGLMPRNSGFVRALKKVAVDQLIFGPINNVMFLLFLTLVVEGKSFHVAMKKISREFITIQRKGWTLWPAAQLINQLFVPLNLRVLWTNCIAFIWSILLLFVSKK